MAQIIQTLTEGQISLLTALVDAKDYPGAYLYLKGITLDNKVSNWLDVAYHVNANDGSFYSEFVRNAAMEAGRHDGNIITGLQFQNASDHLAETVLRGIISRGGIYDLDSIISLDVKSAVNGLGLNIEGWSGTLTGNWSVMFGGIGLESDSPFYTELYQDWKARGIDSWYEKASVWSYMFARNYIVLAESSPSIFKDAYKFTMSLYDDNGAVIKDKLILLGDGGQNYVTSDSDSIIITSSGSDTINSSKGSNIIDAGDGVDTIAYISSNQGVNVDLFSGSVTYMDGSLKDTINGVENIIGSSYRDIILGDEKDNRIDGGGGNDIIDGDAGNDVLLGGSGFDTYDFNGSYGSDTIIDSDQQGSIVIGGVALSGTAKTESSENSNSMTPIYKLTSNSKTYELTLSGSDLVIRDPDDINNMITVKGFKNGSFGITLDEDTDSDDSGLDGPFGVFQGAVQSAVPPKDPLIVDVNGDGLKLSSWQSSAVRFDMDGNGTSESTGWTTPSSANYEYVSGSGSIIIDQANANLIDRIAFGAGISKDDLTFSKVDVWDSSVPDNLFNLNQF